MTSMHNAKQPSLILNSSRKKKNLFTDDDDGDFSLHIINSATIEPVHKRSRTTGNSTWMQITKINASK